MLTGGDGRKSDEVADADKGRIDTSGGMGTDKDKDEGGGTGMDKDEGVGGKVGSETCTCR